MSATLIVRDEASTLPSCLASLDGLVDEIVVVDTGSTDESPQIAARFGARVVHEAWHGDFSAARNAALSYARGDWILYIDADERARPLSRDALAATLDDSALVAATVKFRCRTGFTQYRECRLFRNDARIRFRNVIHETMLPDIHAVMREDGTRIGASDLALDHYGYDGDQARKHARNAPLLRARLLQDPGHVYSWNHLGQVLEGLGDHAGATAAWRRATDIVRAARVRSPLDALPYGSLLVGSNPADPALLDEALERFPDDCLFRWLQGRRLLDAGRYAEALAVLEDLANTDAETYCSDDGVAYDVRIFGAAASEAVALCLFKLRRYDESARYYARACALDPGNPAHVVKQRLALARAGRPAAADAEADDLSQARS